MMKKKRLLSLILVISELLKYLYNVGLAIPASLAISLMVVLSIPWRLTQLSAAAQIRFCASL